MFEVLVYVYENYWQGDACPEPRQLGRKLTAAGFEADEIEAALTWLNGLHLAAHNTRASGLSEEEVSPRPERQVLLQAQSPTACVFTRSPSKTIWAPRRWAL